LYIGADLKVGPYDETGPEGRPLRWNRSWRSAPTMKPVRL